MQKSGILAQSNLVIERLKQHRWSLGIAGAISALGMATAIAVAPRDVQPTTVETVVETLTLQQLTPLAIGETGFLREERIQRGDTLGSLFARLGVEDSEAQDFIRRAPETRALHQQLAPGKIVTARMTASGTLLSLFFPLNNKDSALLVERGNGGFAVREKALRFETHTLIKAAEISSSLFAATDAAGIPDAISTQLADIFSGEIDFHRDLRKNDRLSVIYEMLYLNGQAIRSGRILAAEFHNNGKIHRATLFEQDGKSAYFTPEGKSLRKAFLRSPLEFSRVTSGFSMRLHPILQEWRAHKGVDYGAPSGTRVRSTADGIVEFAGRQGGYGNMIVIKHAGAFSTAYAHLQGFGPGIRKGSRVTQGDIIGYVGSSGWATGPHLHYEFRVNNQQVNPLSVKLPTSLPLDSAQLQRFKAQTAPWMTSLGLLQGVRLANAE